MENQEPQNDQKNQDEIVEKTNNFDKEKVLDFYKKGLPGILKTFFNEPISGTYSLLSEKTETGFANSIFLIATTSVLYTIIPYIMMGEYRSMAGGFGTTFKMGLIVGLLLIVISLISFGVKSVSGKPVFKNELLTGALSGIPISIFIIFAFFAKTFFTVDASDILSMDLGGLKAAGILGVLIALYIFLMLINILQQSLKAGGTKDALAWYLSPIGVMLAFYITQKIGMAFLN